MFKLLVFIAILESYLRVTVGHYHFLRDISLIGRWTEANSADWSGSEIRFFVSLDRNETASIYVSLNQCKSCNYFIGAYINCENYATFGISNESNGFSLTLPQVNTSSVLAVSLVKLTEPNTGVMEVENISIQGGVIVTDIAFEGFCKPMDYNRKMLFIGDSITVGYGVEGEDPCPYSPSTENVLHAYGALTASNFSSLYHAIAWSGRGVVRNYGENENTSKSLTIPELYNRTLATSNDSSLYWDPSNYQVRPFIQIHFK